MNNLDMMDGHCVACHAKIDEDTAFKKYFCSQICWYAETG